MNDRFGIVFTMTGTLAAIGFIVGTLVLLAVALLNPSIMTPGFPVSAALPLTGALIGGIVGFTAAREPSHAVQGGLSHAH